MDLKKVMKTALVLLLLCALLFTLVGCSEKLKKTTDASEEATTKVTKTTEPPTNKTEPDSTEFTEPTHAEATLSLLREDLEMSGDLCGVAYLGGFSGEFADFEAFLTENGALEWFPFLENLPAEHFVATGGWEVYLVIPCDSASNVTVHEWVVDESNDYTGAPGQLLYESQEGNPFVLCCNVSNIMPDTQITVSDGEQTVEYNPSLSLEDGSLWIPESTPVLDITPSRERNWFCGPWEGYILPDDGRESNYLYFEIREDGSLYYAYGLYGENGYELTNSYEGMWYSVDDESYPDGCLSLNLWLVSGEDGCPTELHTVQFPEPSGVNEGGMTIYMADGDWLTPSHYEYGIELWPAIG